MFGIRCNGYEAKGEMGLKELWLMCLCQLT